MTQNLLPTFLLKPLKRIALNEGFENPDFEFAKGSDVGFIGLIERCIIKEKNRSLSVICKFLPGDDHRNQKFGSIELFEREVLVYQKFFPEVEKIQLENGLKYRDGNGFWSYPKCYTSEFNLESPEKSFIIMEDLSAENFVMKSMFEPSDFPHIEKVVIELGKLHAISFVLRSKKPEVFAQFTGLKDRLCHVMTTEDMKDLAPRNCQLAADLFKEDHEKLKRNLILSYKNNLWEQMEVVLDASNAEPFGVICHGDCWINNVMYNYENENPSQIKDIRLLDWQMTRFGSGPSELISYLFPCSDKLLRDEHQSGLFSTYYVSLGKILKRFEMNVETVFPLSRFEEHLKKFGKFAFALSTFAMPIDRKYPEKLFKDPNAQLNEEEKIAVSRYGNDMRDIINDLIDMQAL